MGILSWIILGALAGWIGSMIMKTNEQQGALANIVVGIIGALIGGFIFNMFGGSDITGFNIYSLFVAVIGSIIVIAIFKALSRRT